MAIRNHTDADFNALSREIECKLVIDFAVPLEITSHDFIISLAVSEEASSESKNPLGEVSANEIEVTIFNTDGIFSPTKESSPYYGQIKTGLKIIPYFRLIDSVDTLNWEQLGVFYVTEWNATITSSTASIYAMDKIKEVLAGDATNVQVVADYSFKAFYEYYFSILGYDINTDEVTEDIIPFAYAEAGVGTTLSELTCAIGAMCYSDRTGLIVVKPITAARALRATLTDADQIVSIKTTQSILKTYDGVALTYRYPQLTMNELVLDIETIPIPTGTSTHKASSFDKGPVAAISHVSLQTLNNDVKIVSFRYTPWLLNIVTENLTLGALNTNLTAYGTLVEFTDKVLSDETSNMLTYSNKYIQTDLQAITYKAFLEAFISNLIPTLVVQIRGNLLLQLGDKITIHSDMYALTFTGIILRAKHSYLGYLRTTLTLLNVEVT